jgi:tetratricopeptide (TPR) repeat protein
VLVARRIISTCHGPLPDLAGPVLNYEPAGRDAARISAIGWPADEPAAATSDAGAQHDAPAGDPGRLLPGAPGGAQGPRFDTRRVLVGAPVGVGAEYQPRGFDDDLERLWGDGGDRRVWLRGGPGLGKSYSARRVMQQALADQSPDREALLIWVDSADPATATRAYADAMDRLGATAPAASKDPADRKARALLGLLATSPWRWLIVLDNADAGSLIGAGLVPPGSNPNGRVLLTTPSRDHRLSSRGRVVAAELFTAEEAESYLRSGVHSHGGGPGPLALASRAETGALAERLGHHPLALSVAAATIVANAMTVADWIAEFTAADRMDAAADEPDRGGYPHLVGATWQVALDRASLGLPDGVVERAAMLAALQDLDGHPAWLWDRPAVAGWVAGGAALARHHGMPVAVRRLIDHGIVELRGGTWRDGRIAIHQLAARAVREAAAPASLADLAGILAREWLLAVTGDPAAAPPDVLHRSLRPIAALPDLPDPARRTAAALLAYRQPTGSAVTRDMAESISPYLDIGGATVRIELARLLADAGDEEAALGRAVQARTAYGRAAELYRQLVADRSQTEDELAEALTRLGELQARLGDPEQARASRARAAQLLERLAGAASDTGTISRHLVDLAALHDLLGDQDAKARTLAHAQALLARPPEDLPGSADVLSVLRQGGTWKALATLMTQAGRPGAAQDCLAREADLYERFPQHWRRTQRSWAGAVEALALLHARSGEWASAERLLTRLTDQRWMNLPASASEDHSELLERREARDARVLLASVQAHLGRREDADQNLARVAEQYREHTSDDGTGLEDLLDSATGQRREILELELEDEKWWAREALKMQLRQLGAAAAMRHRWEDAAGLYGALLDLAQQAAVAAPGDADEEADLADAYQGRGLALTMQHAWDDAAIQFQRAIGIRRLLAALDPGRPDPHLDLARAHFVHAACLDAAGRHQAAADAAAGSVTADRRALELAPDNREAGSALADALNLLAGIQTKLGNLDDAVGSYEEVIRILSGLAGRAPDDHTAQRALADALKRFGGTLLAHDRPEAALDPLRRAHDIYSDMAARQTARDSPTRKDLAQVHQALGWALDRTGDPQDAVHHYTEAVTAYRALADRAPDDPQPQQDLALALAALGGAHADNGRQEEAADCLARSANILQLLADLDPGERPEFLIEVLERLAQVLRDLGRTEEADQAEARAADLAQRYPDEGGTSSP